MTEMLDIVNEHDEVIGQAERTEVHQKGLLCRMVYVYFYTPDGHIILQKRSLSKASHPGKLTTTMSGHVSSGQSYIEAAVRETQEETGIQVTPAELIHLGTLRADYIEGKHYFSNAMRTLYAYKFTGDINDLKVEPGDGAGFVSLTIPELKEMIQSQPERFVTILTDAIGTQMLAKIQNLLAK